jgi:hypothetical protein
LTWRRDSRPFGKLLAINGRSHVGNALTVSETLAANSESSLAIGGKRDPRLDSGTVAGSRLEDNSPLPSVPADRFSGPGGIEHQVQSSSQAIIEELWTSEVDRLFNAAVAELRRQAEERVAAAERRRVAELTELSRAVMRQHEIIESLRNEAIAMRQDAVLSLAKARREWAIFEEHRMKAAQEAWEREREELVRVANHHQAVAEQLADQVATLEAIQKSTEREYFERLKEITAEVDRCLLRARAEWVHEMARMAGGSKWELPAFLKVEGS